MLNQIFLSRANILKAVDQFVYLGKCYIKECANTNPCWLNTDLQATNTTIEIDCAYWGHVTRHSKYIKQSDRGLTRYVK